MMFTQVEPSGAIRAILILPAKADEEINNNVIRRINTFFTGFPPYDFKEAILSWKSMQLF